MVEPQRKGVSLRELLPVITFLAGAGVGMGLCYASSPAPSPSQIERVADSLPSPPRDYSAEISAGRIVPGMVAGEAREAWGAPREVNRTTTDYGISEQWVYGGDRYVYIEDGVVVAVQE